MPDYVLHGRSAGVARALDYRYNVDARDCFEYVTSFATSSWDLEDERLACFEHVPSFERRSSWDSEDER